MIIGITGHRPNKLGGYDDKHNRAESIKQILKEIFMEKKPSCVVSGMALGVDQWAVEVALDLNIKVLALIPCKGQEIKWPYPAQVKYKELLNFIADNGGSVEYISNEFYNLALHQMAARNQKIVDYSTDIIAVWDRSWGGTGSCVRLARLAHRPITIIHPQTLEIVNETV